jgi:hypothetical protein
MKILYLTDHHPDYLSDDLLYGLRSVLGPEVVDHPRKEILYRNSPHRVNARHFYGRGFNCFGMEDIPVDRSDLAARVAAGDFDVIINSSVRRILCPLHSRLVVIDGEDGPGLSWRYKSLVPLYFKRELYAPRRGVEPILFALPDFLNDQGSPPRTQRVHASYGYTSEQRRELAKKFPPSYTYDDWASYRDDIRQSCFGLSPKGNGYDCQRHYEILGQAVLCIYLDAGAPYLLREQFRNDDNCLTFSSTQELEEKMAACHDPERLIERGRQDLERFHLASRRAEQMLGTISRQGMSGKKPGVIGRVLWRRWLEQALKRHSKPDQAITSDPQPRA